MKDELLNEEAMIIRYTGGEIPEVTYHGSIYYLTEDHEGPGLVLDDEDLRGLRTAVVQRYRDIILRDLMPDNRDQPLYRGLARCMVNWERLCKFGEEISFDLESLRAEVVTALHDFLRREAVDVHENRRRSCINCTSSSLESFIKELGIDPDELPAGWQGLCKGAA